MLDIRLGTRYGRLGAVGTLGTVWFVRFVRLVRYGWYALYAWYGTVGTVGTVGTIGTIGILGRYAWYTGCGTFSAVVGTVGTIGTVQMVSPGTLVYSMVQMPSLVRNGRQVWYRMVGAVGAVVAIGAVQLVCLQRYGWNASRKYSDTGTACSIPWRPWRASFFAHLLNAMRHTKLLVSLERCTWHTGQVR